MENKKPKVKDESKDAAIEALDKLLKVGIERGLTKKEITLYKLLDSFLEEEFDS